MPRTKTPEPAAPAMDLAAKADRMATLRQQRLDLQKQAEAIEEEEKTLRKTIIDELLASTTMTGVSGMTVRVTLVPKTVPQVEDWEAFQKHIKKTGDFDLIQRRVSDKAVRERWEAGKTVPGVTTYTFHDLSVNKL